MDWAITSLKEGNGAAGNWLISLAGKNTAVISHFHSLSARLTVKQWSKHAWQNAIHLSLQTCNSRISQIQNISEPRRRLQNEGKRNLYNDSYNERLQLTAMKFLESILSHVEILFGAICQGRRDRIYCLLHCTIAGLGALLRCESWQKPLIWRERILA